MCEGLEAYWNNYHQYGLINLGLGNFVQNLALSQKPYEIDQIFFFFNSSRHLLSAWIWGKSPSVYLWCPRRSVCRNTSSSSIPDRYSYHANLSMAGMFRNDRWDWKRAWCWVNACLMKGSCAGTRDIGQQRPNVSV